MKQRTTWSPDTCGCELEYEWDDTDPPETRVHTGAVIRKACPAHASLIDPKLHHVGVLGDNQLKNRALAIIARSEPGIGIDDQIKPDVVHRWELTADRRLRLYFKDMDITPARKAVLRTLLDTRLGIGKVELLSG